MRPLASRGHAVEVREEGAEISDLNHSAGGAVERRLQDRCGRNVSCEGRRFFNIMYLESRECVEWYRRDLLCFAQRISYARSPRTAVSDLPCYPRERGLLLGAAEALKHDVAKPRLVAVHVQQAVEDRVAGEVAERAPDIPGQRALGAARR